MVLDLKEAFAGGIGAICCAYSGNPFDVVKVRLQTQPSQGECVAGVFYTGPIDCLRKIIRNEGLFALWKGVTPSLGSALLENAVVFSTVGAIRRLYLSSLSTDPFDHDRHLSVKERALVGGLAGVVSATVCTVSFIVLRQAGDATLMLSVCLSVFL